MSKVKFGDIVREVKVNVDRENNPYEFYVAGDHMDSEDLTIRRKGRFDTDDVGPAFTRIFKPGQILYGSRRTYLKKVAVADFEGICANTTFVLESKDPNVFCQELLPFIMLSDEFSKWSIGHSKGSTNPYVLFSDLAGYEFGLPSIEEQKVLADKLWAAYKVKESYRQLLATTDEMLIAQFHHMFGNVDNPKVKVCRLGDICDVERGGSPRPISAFITNNDDGVNWIKIGDAENESMYINKTEEKIIHEGIKMSRMVHKGDLLLSNSMSFGHPYILNIDGCIHDGWLVLHLNPKIVTPIFLCRYLGLQSTYQQFKKLAAGGVVKNLNKDVVKVLPVIIPTLEDQQLFAEIAAQAEATKASLRASIEAIDRVIRSLINQ